MNICEFTGYVLYMTQQSTLDLFTVPNTIHTAITTSNKDVNIDYIPYLMFAFANAKVCCC